MAHKTKHGEYTKMRCKGEDCRKCRKNKLNRAKCWSKWGLCGACAVKKYPKEYRRKVVESHKNPHKYKILDKPGINGFQGMKQKGYVVELA